MRSRYTNEDRLTKKIIYAIDRLYSYNNIDFISLDDFHESFKQAFHKRIPDGFAADISERDFNTTIRIIFNELLPRELYLACINDDKIKVDSGLSYLRKYLLRNAVKEFTRLDQQEIEDVAQTALEMTYMSLHKVQDARHFIQFSESILRKIGHKVEQTVDRDFRIGDVNDVDKYAINYDDEGDVAYPSSAQTLAEFEYYYLDWEDPESTVIEQISIENVLSQLPYVLKEILILRMENYPYSYIAQRTGKSIKEIRSLISKAWELLQESGISLDDNFSLYRQYVSKAYYAENAENWNDAIKSYRMAKRTIKKEFPKAKWKLENAKVNFYIGKCMIKDARWVDALTLFQKLSTSFAAEKMYFWKAETYFYISYIFEMMNLYEPSLLYYREAFHLFEAFRESSPDLKDADNPAVLGMAKSKECLGNLEFRLNILRQSRDDLSAAVKFYDLANKRYKAYEILPILTNIDSMLNNTIKEA